MKRWKMAIRGSKIPAGRMSQEIIDVAKPWHSLGSEMGEMGGGEERLCGSR